jgi:hypothetical protein
MTELQRVFLFYACVYLVVKGALFLGFYVVLIMLERQARIKHAKCKAFIRQKRIDEQQRWKVAYQLYRKRYNPGWDVLNEAS